MPKRNTKIKQNPFDPSFAPYGHASAPGNPEQWRSAYEQAFYGKEQSAQILDQDNPYVILGLNQGASPSEVKKAYRRIVMAECANAFGLNPDPAIVERFKKVHAAYSFLS